MNRAQQLLTLLSGGAAAGLSSYIQSLAPALWVDFDQVSSPLPNKGSSAAPCMRRIS